MNLSSAHRMLSPASAALEEITSFTVPSGTEPSRTRSTSGVTEVTVAPSQSVTVILSGIVLPSLKTLLPSWLTGAQETTGLVQVLHGLGQ